MTDVNQWSYGYRNEIGSAAESKMVRLLTQELYNTEELEKLGIEKGPYIFILSKSVINIDGTDILIKHRLSGRLLATKQAKRRFSTKGTDVGLELARIFKRGKNSLVLGGGRDLWVPLHNQDISYVWNENYNLWLEDGSWRSTKSEFYIVSAVNSTDYMVFRTEKIKEIAKDVFDRIKKNWHCLEPELYRHLYLVAEDKSMMINKFLGYEENEDDGIDVQCQRDKGEDDAKIRTVVDKDGNKRGGVYSKAIVYIRPDILEYGVDYVTLRRR